MDRPDRWNSVAPSSDPAMRITPRGFRGPKIRPDLVEIPEKDRLAFRMRVDN